MAVQKLEPGGQPKGDPGRVLDEVGVIEHVSCDVLDLEGENGLVARVAGNPIKFDGEADAPHHYPPALGQHSRQVLQQVLGLGDSEYEDCLKKGVVREAGGVKEQT